MGRFFWDSFSADIFDAGIRNLFFESGSTIAYLSAEFRSFLQRPDGRRHFDRWELNTNNIITYLQFVLSGSVHIDLRPDGPPEDIYGASFGAIASIGRYRKPSKPVYQYKQLLDVDRKLVDETVANLVPHDRPSLFLCTSSGLELSDEAPFPGLHVGSFHNKLFKQAILGTSVPIVQFLDASKISTTSINGKFQLNKCYPVCDSQKEWDYACTRQPIAFCIGSESEEDFEKIEKVINAIGFSLEYKADVDIYVVGFFPNSSFRKRFGTANRKRLSANIKSYFRATRVADPAKPTKKKPTGRKSRKKRAR